MVTTFAQRRNHDLQVFDDPRSMVDGSVTPPLVSIDNPAIVRRHVHAMAFAAFERREVLDYERSQHRTVSDFFEASDGPSTAAERFMTWLRTNPPDLLDAVTRVVPPSVAREVGLPHAWIDDLDQIDEERGTGWLARAADEISQELEELDQAYNQAKVDDRLGYAQSLKLVGATLRGRPLVNFLAQRVVLPKYGFPVDVVILDVLQRGDRDSQRVQLDRDLSLAIVDYAPGATVVAAKALWEGIGLKKLPGRALVLRSWALCADCGAFPPASTRVPPTMSARPAKA